MPIYELREVSLGEEIGHEALVVIVRATDASHAALAGAVDAWAEVLTASADDILGHDLLEDRDPWFGFGVQVGKKVLDEAAVFAAARDAAELEAPTRRFLRALIAFNRTQDESLSTHEELETGTSAALWLLSRSLDDLPLYLEYLETLDLDHTVAQLDVLFALSKRYGPEDLAPLKSFAAARGVQVLNDWLDEDRVWKTE